MTGIILVAFGKDFAELAVDNMNYSKQFHDLPYCVLTNVKDVPDSIYFDLEQKANRDIKTRMNEFTPFDITYYIDVDAVVQNPLPDFTFETDLLISRYCRWEKNEKIIRIYKRTMEMLKVDLPITVYSGGFIGFKNNKTTDDFFEQWHLNWQIMGMGREMPSLACAIKSTQISITELKKGIYNEKGKDLSSIIQHDYGRTFFEDFNIKRPEPFKPFDNDPQDWNWV